MAYPIDMRNEDRPPWLETIKPDEERRPSTAGRAVALTLLGLGLIAAIAFGMMRWQAGRSGGGEGALIAAPTEAYKVRPNDPGGLKVEGEGDAAIATSAGAGAGNGAVDLGAVPETPIAGENAPRPNAVPTADARRSAVAAVPASGGKLVAAEPMGRPRANVPGGVGGGSLVQLGAFPTEAAANGAWGEFAKRFGYIAALGKSVEQADVNGLKVYRLRINAGSANQAADICARLRIAGESCFVTS